MELQLLLKEHDKLLVEYETLYLNYIAALKQKNFEIIPNSSFIGNVNYKTEVMQNIEQCKAKCSTDYATCSGATFNSVSGNCFLQSGQGNIITDGAPNNNAIINVIQKNSADLETMRKKLDESDSKINQLMPSTLSTLSLSTTNTNTVEKYYRQLKRKRKTLENNKNDDHAKYDNSSIIVNQKTIHYSIWVIFAVAIILLTIIVHTFPDVNIIGKFFPLFLFAGLLLAYLIYQYLEQFHLYYPDIDFAYYLNKLQYYYN
jgi:hypothetical protein